jgi:hypothetical protein
MSACPKRTDAQFEQGTAAGTAAHAAAVREWIKSNLSDAGSELRTIDQRDRNVMLFNDWLGQNGYEQFADWVKDSDGWSAVCRMDDELQPQVPTAESMIEYAFQMANGDKESCPKGGRAEYRNGEWYKRVSGRRQGDMMTEENAGEFGHGAHSDTPNVASTIEQKFSNISTWFDNVLKDSLVANPGRNYHVKKMKTTLAKQLGRARLYECGLLEEADDAVLQSKTDLNSTYETATLDYMTTNTAHGTRAADNLLLDWADITVNGVGDAGAELPDGTLRGLALKFQKTKNNTEQRDRPAKPLQCLSSCTLGAGSMKVTKDGRLEGGGCLCPAHLKLRLKELQARDVGVLVAMLEGPVYGDYVKIEKLPAGATLVKAESGISSDKAPRLVLVVTRDEEAAGLMYDRSVPFEADGK